MVIRTSISGAERIYRLWTPATHGGAPPEPLVLLFHGFAGDGRRIADLTGLPARGTSRGFIVVTADGSGRTWQFTGGGTDATFVDSIVSTVTAAHCVDLNRVFVAGFSAGAAFTIAYSCARPDRIAAIATVAVDFQLGCRRPTSILAFHGTDDPLVPYRNGAVGASLPGVHVRGTELNMGDWAKLGRCSSAASVRRSSTHTTVSVWPGCAGGTEVELYTIDHGSHLWPGGQGPGSVSPAGEINATDLMLDFFSHHRLHAG